MLIMTISCGNKNNPQINKTEKEAYKNGIYKTYHPNGEINAYLVFRKNKLLYLEFYNNHKQIVNIYRDIEILFSNEIKVGKESQLYFYLPMSENYRFDIIMNLIVDGNNITDTKPTKAKNGYW